MHSDIIEKAGAIVERSAVHTMGEGPEPYCVLALIDQNGYPTASTITAAKADGIREIYFCTGLSSNKAKRIVGCNRASVCLSGLGSHNITLVGTIETLTDPAVKKAMWYEGMGQHFKDAEDPDYCVLRFKTERYNLFVDFTEAEGNL